MVARVRAEKEVLMTVNDHGEVGDERLCTRAGEWTIFSRRISALGGRCGRELRALVGRAEDRTDCAPEHHR
jgi:hypothetical protein